MNWSDWVELLMLLVGCVKLIVGLAIEVRSRFNKDRGKHRDD